LKERYYNIVVLILLSCSVSAFNLENFTLNTSQLPFHSNYSVHISKDYDSFVNVSYDSWLSGITEVNFSGTEYILDVYIDVSNYNFGVYERFFNVTRNSYGETIQSDYSFIFNILNDTVLQQNTTNWTLMGLNDYHYDFCTYQVPINFTHTLSVSGEPNSYVYPQCNGTSMTCPYNFTLDSNGLSSMSIFFRAITYNSNNNTIDFISNNRSIGNASFYIFIKDCISPMYLPYCDEYYRTCSDSFNYTYAEKIRCKSLEIDCDIEQLKLMRDSQQIIYNNVTDVKYVDRVIDLNDKVSSKIEAIATAIGEFNDIKAAYDTTQSRMEELTLENVRLQNESEMFRQQMPSMFREYSENLYRDNLNKTKALLQMEQETVYKSQVRNWILFGILGIIVIGLLLIQSRESTIPG